MDDNSILYSIPYILVGFLLFILYLLEKRAKYNNKSTKKYNYIALILLIVFIGLRGHVYTDFINYYPFYKQIPPIYELSINNITTNVEIGYYIYTSLLKAIIPEYHTWVFINSLIDILLLYYFFKKYTQSAILTFLLFLAYWGLTIEFNLFRNIKSFLLFLISFKYLTNGKFTPYLILNLLGFLFHSSSLVYILLYPIFRLKLKKTVIIIIIFIINILYFSNVFITSLVLKIAPQLLDGHFVEKLYNHISNSSEIGLTFGYVERTFEIFLFLFLGNKIKKQLPEYNVFFNIALVYYCVYLLFSDISIFTQRFPLLFVVGYWILLSNIFFIKFPLKKIYTFLIIIFAFYRLYATNTTIVSKYDNLLWGIESYENRRSSCYSFMN